MLGRGWAASWNDDQYINSEELLSAGGDCSESDMSAEDRLGRSRNSMESDLQEALLHGKSSDAQSLGSYCPFSIGPCAL